MKRNKLFPTLVVVVASFTFSFGAASAANAANENANNEKAVNENADSHEPQGPRMNHPLPPRCYPEYMTSPGDCFML